MSNEPTDVAQQAIDACGISVVLGDLEDGTKEAQVLLRAYGQCLRQLLRSVHWNFARFQAPMVLLADATGNTPNVGANVIKPWVYEYSYPINCMKARFVPWTPQGLVSPVPPGNIVPANPNVPLTTGLGNPVAGAVTRPARWLEATDPNYPAPAGALTWDVQGVSPQGRTVILTNVRDAQLVYTALLNYPSVWDAQFRAAFVAYLASEVAFSLWSTKGKPEFGMKVRDENMKIAAGKIMQARVTDGNEGWSNSDIIPDWFRGRNIGGGEQGAYSQQFGSIGGPGIYYSGLDGCCGTGNTSAY